ncbi:MAG: hypothetical protein R3F16_03020 [Myxococcota bacterium]
MMRLNLGNRTRSDRDICVSVAVVDSLKVTSLLMKLPPMPRRGTLNVLSSTEPKEKGSRVPGSHRQYGEFDPDQVFAPARTKFRWIRIHPCRHLPTLVADDLGVRADVESTDT